MSLFRKEKRNEFNLQYIHSHMKNEWHGKNTDEARRTGKNLFGHLEITQQACERRNETQGGNTYV